MIQQRKVAVGAQSYNPPAADSKLLKLPQIIVSSHMYLAFFFLQIFGYTKNSRCLEDTSQCSRVMLTS